MSACEILKSSFAQVHFYFEALISDGCCSQPTGKHRIADSLAARPGYRQQEQILMVVNEDICQIDLIKAFCRLYKLRQLSFSDGQSAIEWYRHNAQSVGLILLDIKMPGIKEQECFAGIKAFNNNARIILTTGFLEQQVLTRLRNTGISRFLTKPFDYPSLFEWIQIDALPSKASKNKSIYKGDTYAHMVN